VCAGGGVVGNTLAQSTRINVRNPPYNAQGDGVTNDTAAFRNAIGDLPLNGTLVVPAGTYMLNAAPCGVYA
jgi:polygalacturonase